MLRTCIFCGQRFETNFPQTRYCSDECRKEGKKKKQIEWERRTNWKAKDRERKKQKLALMKQSQNQSKIDKAIKDGQIRLRRIQEENDRKCADGDLFRLMIRLKAEHGNSSPEYWDAYSRYIIDYYERNGRSCSVMVNGIEVYTENFGDEVSDSIKQLGFVAIY